LVARIEGEEEEAIAAYDIAAQGVQTEAAAADDVVELRGLRNRHEPLGVGACCGNIEAEEAGRVEATESAEEGMRGGEAEPALADKGGADETGGEGDVEEDLAEEVVIIEHS
jgi:hypothetical protein